MKSLEIILFTLLLNAATFAGQQSAQFEIPLTVTDNAGGSQLLYCGVDPLGSDGIDGILGEAELPPVPLTGVFDGRFVGDDIGIGSMGQGLLRDYRLGNATTNGTRIHELKYQVGSGTTITIGWTMPSWASGRLQDIITGSIIDVAMTGAGNYTVTNPGGLNKLKLTITYNGSLPVQLASFAGTIINQQSHVRLNWRTLTETNNYGFSVQKSANNASNYQTISPLIPGHGTTLEPHDYSWLDATSITSGTLYYRLKQIDLDGAEYYSESIQLSRTSGVREKTLPAEFGLSQNYPNPFNPSTKIEFALPKQSHVTLVVFNLIGQRVATLLDEVRPAGFHTVEFVPRGFSGGLYLYQMTTNDNITMMKRMILLK